MRKIFFSIFLISLGIGLSLSAQANGLSLDVAKECNFQYAGDNCIAEFDITNSTGEVLNGTAFFDVGYNGICGNYFKEGGINAWYDNQVSKMEWNDEAKKFVSAGFEILNGLNKANLEIHTSSALCPGEYSFGLQIKGISKEEEKEYITPLVTAGVGGGGAILPPSLTILDESIIITNITETSITISWITSYNSTSQVIYGADGESHTLDLNDSSGLPPKYGYAHTTSELDVFPKVKNHSVTIMGLTSGTTYYYRTVSHGSLAVSQEYSFTTLTPEGEVAGATIEVGEEAEESIGGEVIPEGAREGEVAGEVVEEGDMPEGEEEKIIILPGEEKAQPSLLAAVGNIVTFGTGSVWIGILVVIVVLAILIYLVYYFSKKSIRKRLKKKEEDITSPPEVKQ